MVKRIAALAITCAACATVAGVEVSRPPADEPVDRDDDDSGAGRDGESAGGGERDGGEGSTDPDGAPISTCECDAGEVCCVRSAGASCVTRDPGSCDDPGSLTLGCTQPSIDGRDCCWNEDGALRGTTLGAGGCATARAACVTDDDCTPYGGACHTRACAGMTFGICAPSDAAVPAELRCPP